MQALISLWSGSIGQISGVPVDWLSKTGIYRSNRRSILQQKDNLCCRLTSVQRLTPLQEHFLTVSPMGLVIFKIHAVLWYKERICERPVPSQCHAYRSDMRIVVYVCSSHFFNHLRTISSPSWMPKGRNRIWELYVHTAQRAHGHYVYPAHPRRAQLEILIESLEVYTRVSL